MNLESSALQVLGAFLIFLAGALLSVKISKFFDASTWRSVFLYLWHTVFCVFSFYYISTYGGDAQGYFEASLSDGIDVSLGNAPVQLVTKLFSDLLGMSFFGTFLAYNIFGFVGLLAFDSALRLATADKSRLVQRLATLVVLLPSVSFWSSAIGKDAISFMATGLALWAAAYFSRRYWTLAASVVLMLMVRPHIAALMVVAIAVSMLVRPGVPALQRAGIGLLAVVISALLLPLAMNRVGMEDDSTVTDFSSYIDKRQRLNMEGGGAIDISSMSLPMKLATYLFRPLPFDANSVSALAASMDNVVLLGVVLLGVWQMFKRRRSTGNDNRSFLWAYFLSTWVILAVTTANLGISVRQKWMCVPMLIYLCISVIGAPRKRGRVPGQRKARVEAGAAAVMPWQRRDG